MLQEVSFSNKMNLGATNLESRLILSYDIKDPGDMTHSDVRNMLLSHQTEWDVLFLDIFEDCKNCQDGDITTAAVFRDTLIKLVNDALSPDTVMMQTEDVTKGIRRIAYRLFDEQGSLKRFAVERSQTGHERSWNKMLSTIENNLSQGWGKIQRCTGSRVRRVYQGADGQTTPLFVPEEETIH